MLSHSEDRDFGVVVGSVESVGTSVGSEFDELWLLVLKAGPLECVAVSMWTLDVIGCTKWERQSAALFFAPDIHSKVIL